MWENPEKFVPRIEEKNGENKEIKEKMELQKLKREGEKIYQESFVEKLDKVLEHEFIVELKEGQKEKIVLKKIIESWLEKFSQPELSNLLPAEQANFQKQFLQELVKEISKIPPGSWSVDFEKAIKTEKMNCSCCSALLGLILESTRKNTKIENIEYGSPVDHAMNVITLRDGKAILVDSRKGIVEELTEVNTEIEEYNDLKIYKIKNIKGKRIYQIVPVLPLKEGILTSYIRNLVAAYICLEGEIPDVFKKYITQKEIEELKPRIKKAREEFNKETKRLQKEGKGELFEKKELFKEKIQFLAKMGEIFAGKLEDYKKTENFQREIERCRDIYYKNE